MLRTVGLIGDGGAGERRGALRVRDGREDWAAWVETLRDSLGFMALEEASMMAVLCSGIVVLDLDVGSSDTQLGSLINKEAASSSLYIRRW